MSQTWQMNKLWQSQGERSHHDDAHLHHLTTNYQLLKPYGFLDKA